MKEIQDGHLEFVSRHFDASALSARKAWRSVRKRVSAPRYTIGYIMAACAVTAAIVTGVFLFSTDSFNRTTVKAEAVARMVILPDRSQVTLAPGATLSFNRHRFAHKDRSVCQTGRIYYEVERNEALPFEIHTSAALVRVLGTSFQVNENADWTSVDVLSGRVLFAAAEEGEGIELTRGMHAELYDGSKTPELTDAATMNPAAWATHHFIYNDAPLEAVLEDLSSAFGRTLVCDRPGHRLSGDFHADSLEDAVSIIETALDVKLTVL